MKTAASVMLSLPKHEPVEPTGALHLGILNSLSMEQRSQIACSPESPFLPLFAPLKRIHHPSRVTKDLLRSRSTESGWIWLSEAKGVSCGSYPV